ncbi:MAG: TIGR02680 family protein, partial [Pseudonocardia sp.]
MTPRITLPRPTRARWQPLRAGLIDLFYYDAEEFWFHDGRLLLRGNNGTGKSKVLALMVPFLLDGDLSPHRVEPDADAKKRMEWNLLLGGEHPYPERLGYTWLEFGRLTERGEEEFRTLGCGLKAVAGRGIARHWYFLTEQRVGPELALVDPTGTALPRERLADALAGHGTLYDRARDYRRGVDEALFGFGEQRYGALVDLLIQLRQPQLSKKPSERALSDALTEALPPLDQAVVADVADAFRSLEEDRDELTAMTEAHGSARSFLGQYRRYAGIAARRRAALPRAAQQAYEKARAALASAETEHEQAERAVGLAHQRLAQLESAEHSLRARKDVLAARPEMQDAARLRAAAALAQRLRGDAARATRDAQDAATTVTAREAKHREASTRADSAGEWFTGRRGVAIEKARAGLLGPAHRREIDARLDSADPPAETALTELRTTATALVERQTRAIGHVDGLLGADAQAQRALAAAHAEVERLAAARDELATRRSDAELAVAEAGQELIAAVREHLTVLRELRVPDPAALLAELELWVETMDGPDPARAGLEAAGHTASTVLGRVEATLDQRESTALAQEDELATEIARLEAGEDGTPQIPHTRDPDTRTNRPGAPFWRLVDFVEGVVDTDRAGLEAALEAAGILDAWVTPDGTLLAPGTDDVVLTATQPAVGPALDAVLRPAIDCADPRAAVAESTVVALLAAIGLHNRDEPAARADAWVGADGRFRVGVLTGSWRKSVAQYIGRGAREAARRARLIELRAAAEAVSKLIAAIAADRQALAGRRSTLATELATTPTADALRTRHASVSELAKEFLLLSGRLREADELLSAAADTATSTREALVEGAAEVGLPVDRAGLDQVRAGLTDYRLALSELWPAARALGEALRAATESAEELATACLVQTERAERAEEVSNDALVAAEEHRTLVETVGAAVAEIERLLAAVTADLQANTRDRKSADAAREQALDERGHAQGRRDTLAGVVATTTTERAEAASALQRFAATGLLGIALPELDVPDPAQPWAPDPAVRLARQIDRELAEIPDDDPGWERAQRRVTEEFSALTATLTRHGNSASAQLREDGIVVEVTFRGRPTTVPELSAALKSNVAESKQLLDEREGEVLEKHMIDEA